MRLGVLEIVLILVVALVVFGGNRLKGVGKALGQSIREFKSEVKGNEQPEAEKQAEEDGKDA